MVRGSFLNPFYLEKSNGKIIHRDYLVWSDYCKSLFCFPCGLFCQVATNKKSVLLNDEGQKHMLKRKKEEYGGKKLPDHESNTITRSVTWSGGIEKSILKIIQILQLTQKMISMITYWKYLLVSILLVVLFLSQRSLEFRRCNVFSRHVTICQGKDCNKILY